MLQYSSADYDSYKDLQHTANKYIYMYVGLLGLRFTNGNGITADVSYGIVHVDEVVSMKPLQRGCCVVQPYTAQPQ